MFLKDLQSLGIEEGDHVTVGMSFKSLGSISSPQQFINDLIAAVGSNGTIMMNSYTNYFSISDVRRNKTNYIFNHKTSKCNTGIVSESLRHHKNALRSRHPIFSVTALGKYAEYLTEFHDEFADAYLPYSRLALINGKALSIGIGNRIVGLRHQAQHLAGLLNAVSCKRAVNFLDEDGLLKTFILTNRAGCTTKLTNLVVYLKKQGLINEGKIGQASAFWTPVKESLEIMTTLLKNNPEINLCDKSLCFWCRELERQLNLYNRLEKPKYFQKYFIVRKIIHLLNLFRESDNAITAKLKHSSMLRRLFKIT